MANPTLMAIAIEDAAEAVVMHIVRANRAGEPDEHTAKTAIEALEREIVKKMMETTGGNQSLTTRLLGLSRGTVRKYMK